jgi:hypothetical protein
VLCPNPSAGVGEHVWPAWLIRDFHGEGPFHTEKSGTPYKKRDNTTVAKFAALPSVHVPMCAKCNARLNTKVEEPAKPVVRRVLPWSSTHAWPTLTADEAAALGRWLLKVGLLLSHPEAVGDNPHTAQDLSAARIEEFCQDWVAWMAAGADPPDDFSVYVTRLSILGEQPWTGDMALLSLPGRVDVATQEQRFMTRSLGIRGLDATIVWHPGWPIRHPLVEDRRAGVLWPHPVRIDLSGLPEVHPREFGFVVEPSSLSFSEAEYARVTKVPLQVGQHYAAAVLGQ